jgi:hypothetical protein
LFHPLSPWGWLSSKGAPTQVTSVELKWMGLSAEYAQGCTCPHCCPSPALKPFPHHSTPLVCKAHAKGMVPCPQATHHLLIYLPSSLSIPVQVGAPPALLSELRGGGITDCLLGCTERRTCLQGAVRTTLDDAINLVAFQLVGKITLSSLSGVWHVLIKTEKPGLGTERSSWVCPFWFVRDLIILLVSFL